MHSFQSLNVDMLERNDGEDKNDAVKHSEKFTFQNKTLQNEKMLMMLLLVRGHPLSTYIKFSEKLTFLTP